MPAINNIHYTTEELLLARICKAIAHPTRARMLLYLLNHGTFRNVDFSKKNGIAISSTHHHVYELKDADLINLEYTNHQYFVTLKTGNLDLLKHLLSNADIS